jgi:hypothetical protein
MRQYTHRWRKLVARSRARTSRGILAYPFYYGPINRSAAQ